ncbi:hypothetical protein DFP93_104260 [Aneurinibacillus soli]|uniref:Uncharacterized protein n=1 Tax=Aneurinibacillus soli TaxID=1500254 RepID=A0A0U5ATU1_9BACL|nr:hypothetical protein DFP93_104260 [Aneurinibacillus soli]BAU27169.1 hypothetical protein CB4_01338 [Aneurinibacillus soli]
MGMSLCYARQGSVHWPLQVTSELAHKRDRDAFAKKSCGQKPVPLSPSAGHSRKSVPLPISSPLLTYFVKHQLNKMFVFGL